MANKAALAVLHTNLMNLNELNSAINNAYEVGYHDGAYESKHKAEMAYNDKVVSLVPEDAFQQFANECELSRAKDMYNLAEKYHSWLQAMSVLLEHEYASMGFRELFRAVVKASENQLYDLADSLAAERDMYEEFIADVKSGNGSEARLEG